MASYTINAVRKEPVAAPVSHQHIASVRLTDGSTLTRAQVIQKINGGDTFTTSGYPAGRVYVHNCPRCGTGDYITTHPDATTTNNLDNLPAY